MHFPCAVSLFIFVAFCCVASVDLVQLQLKSGTDAQELLSTLGESTGVPDKENSNSNITGNATFYLMRLPKTSSTSIMSDTRPKDGNALQIPWVGHEETSFCGASQKGKHKVVTMMREPFAHVYSQYMHCTTSAYKAKMHMPPTMDKWVNTWLQTGKSKNASRIKALVSDTCCYNPWNLQTRRMSCLTGSSNLSAAIENLNSVFHVGLTEYYRESMCLLSSKIRGTLLDGCACGSEDQFHMSLVTHGVKKHSVTDLSAATRQKIESFTGEDQQLYEVAKRRFLSEIRQLEESTKTKILCNGKTKPALLMFDFDFAETQQHSMMVQFGGEQDACSLMQLFT